MAVTQNLNITVEFLQELLAESDPDLTITSFQVTEGSGRGDNYTAMLYRIRVQGTKAGQSESWTRSLIYKCLPDNAARRLAFKSDALFRNEVAVYTRALPALLQFQDEKGVGASFQSVPHCYLARSDMVVLEDLQARGFSMADRKTGLDVPHCEAVLRELARFHGLSLAMKLLEPDRFQEHVSECVTEAFFVPENEEWYSDYYKAATGNALAMVKEALASEDDQDRYLSKLRLFVDGDSFFSRMMSLVTPQEPLSVLCHGDCWTNNILFRYSEMGNIEEVCLVDFQLARYGSPALDLANLLYCCTSREMRSQHMARLLADYHRHLVATLTEFGCCDVGSESDITDPDKLWDTLQDEVRRCGRFGLGLALDMIPICMCDSDQAPDLYVTSRDKQDVSNVPVWTSSELCRRKMADLVQELVDNGDL